MLTFKELDRLRKIRQQERREQKARAKAQPQPTRTPREQKPSELSEAVEPGGLLHGGAEIKARALRDTYRAWRRLIEDLHTEQAQETLRRLNVTVRKQGKGFVFQLAQF